MEEEVSDLVAVFVLLSVPVSVVSDSVLVAESVDFPFAEAVSAVFAASPMVADSAALVSIHISVMPKTLVKRLTILPCHDSTSQIPIRPGRRSQQKRAQDGKKSEKPHIELNRYSYR